jgi:hypothetical protein
VQLQGDDVRQIVVGCIVAVVLQCDLIDAEILLQDGPGAIIDLLGSIDDENRVRN